jgi:uncharacterized protein YbaP (TraB family)
MKQSAIFLFVALGFLWAGAYAQHPGIKKKQQQAPVKPPSAAAKTAPPVIKKYPSLLWEITGNGLKQPSYLFGTMHVSDKLAFHLGDSFYNAIKSVNVVALETNPENWQEDFSHSVFYRNANRRSEYPGARRSDVPYDFMQITTFAIDTYEEKIKAALAVEPSMINGMLYRNYDEQQGDFEEDTFLDMYIFQVGKKLGKRVCGVEDFKESEKLVMEAYRDMIKDQNKKRRSYDYESMMTNPKKVEEAYRKGDLDLLDSLETLTVFSEAFQEKFLYKRNEIQANSIDTIMKKHALFVGVGAAHLPGPRGVIEMLRQKGYQLRPVLMDDRNSSQKESIEKMHPEKSFTQQSSDDGFFKVSIPGDKFYRFTDWQGMDVVQYADMVNGAYYMVTRIKTNSLFWGHSNEQVYKKIDSLLYENVPGKILKKSVVSKNGYKGFDFTNRTRRGDYQRYQVFITPFEIIVFKISGTGDFINSGNTAQQFFNSVGLREYPAANWKTWQPATGGFSVELPHAPSLLRDNSFGTDRLEYASKDEQDGNSYLIMQANLHNYTFLEEDTFELRLMDESYGYSTFIDKQVSRHFTKVNDHSALESKYRHKDGSFSSVKYVIRGPVYYVAVARYKQENANVQKFLKSFTITGYKYPEPKKHSDSLLHMTVTSPVYPVPKPGDDMAAEAEELFRQAYRDNDNDDDDMKYESKLIGNDTTGEKILVSYTRVSKYAYEKDSSKLWESRYGGQWTSDSTMVVSLKKERREPNGFLVRDLVISDTGCSRQLLVKSFYKNGHFFHLSAITDTIGGKSAFIENFFSSFKPEDTLKGISLFTRKSDQLFNDLFSKDSLVAKSAAESIYGFKFDSADVPNIKKAINSLHWGMRNYLNRKQRFIGVLGTLKDPSITPWLKELYWKVKDTVAFQNAILQALLSQKTKASFITFKDLVIQEPPIVDDEIYDYRETRARAVITSGRYERNVHFNSPWDDLYDTLSLAKSIFPDFLQLMHVDDYREDVLELLVAMVDSGYLQAKDYETYFSKIYVDGRQLLKKQLAREDKEKMDKAAAKDRRSNMYYGGYAEEDREMDAGNSELDKYVVLLLPFRDKNPGVQTFFEQLLQTRDRRLVYNTFIHLLRHKQKVPDSLFTQFAAIDKYRSELYKDLEKMKMLDKFPAAHKNQLSIARSMLAGTGTRYDRMDTVAFVEKLPVAYEGKKGFVYFFKYKRMRDDAAWQVASVGMQPEKLTEIDIDNDDFTVREERKLDNDKPVKEQLELMLKEMVYSRRSSASMFYEGRDYSLYKNYLSEMVKNQRYRD